MELYQLKTFITVAEEKHLTRASDKLCITQPAVSSQIKQLEEELGLVLFIRSPKGMVLTSAGQHIRDKALKILEYCEELKKTAGMLSQTITGSLMIGVNTSLWLLKIDLLTRQLGSSFPRLELHIINRNSPDIIKGILEKTLDIGFIFGECEAKIKCVKLDDLEVVIIGPKKYEAEALQLELKDLSRYPWIKPPAWCAFQKVTAAHFKEKGLQPERYLVSDDDELMKNLAIEQESFSLALQKSTLKALAENKIFIWPYDTFKVPLQLVFDEQMLKIPYFTMIIESLLALWDRSL